MSLNLARRQKGIWLVVLAAVAAPWAAERAWAQTNITSISASPDPFNPEQGETTTITVEADSNVLNLTVRVLRSDYTTLVRTGLALTELPAGSGVYSVLWDGKNGSNQLVGGDFAIRVYNIATSTYMGPWATVHATSRAETVTASPNPFVPTGCSTNPLTVAVTGTPGQVGLKYTIYYSSWNTTVASSLPLIETEPGLYTGEWDGVPSTGSYNGRILPAGNYVVYVYDAGSYQFPTYAIFSTTGTVTSANCSPSSFKPSLGQTTTINVLGAAGQDMDARIYQSSTLKRTLAMSEAVAGTHTAVWDGKDELGETLAAGSYSVQVWYSNCDKRHYTGASVTIDNLASVTATPNPFTPTGCPDNVITIGVQSTPGQTGLMYSIYNDSYNNWVLYRQPLTETAAGTYTATWDGVPSYGSYVGRILPNGNYLIYVYDASGYQFSTSGTFSTTGTVTSANCSPSSFKPSLGQTTTINVLGAAGQDMDARIYQSSTLKRTLPMSEAVAGTHTAVWDGKDELGETLATGSYSIQAWYRNCNQRHYTGTSVTIDNLASVTATPNPFTPTGCADNVITIGIQSAPGQTGLKYSIYNDSYNNWVLYRQPLTETAAGTYTATWDGVPSYGSYIDRIMPNGNYIIYIYDASGYQLSTTGTFSTTGTVTSANCSPSSFKPALGQTTTINVLGAAGQDMDARIYQSSTLKRTLSMSEAVVGTHTAVWDGKDELGNALAGGSYSVQAWYRNCNKRHYTSTTATVDSVVDITATPNPFTPTGCADNLVTISVQSTPGQTGLKYSIYYNPWSTWVLYRQPLTETAAGTYTATWDGVPNYGSYVGRILPSGTHTIHVNDASGWQSSTTLALSVLSVASSQSPSPNPFKPDGSNVVTFRATGTTGLSLNAGVFNGSVMVRSLPMTEASGVYTAVWNGKDIYGNFAGPGSYVFRPLSSGCDATYYPAQSLTVQPPDCSISASPQPFSPTGENAATIEVRTGAGLVGVTATVAMASQNVTVPLTETGSAGTYVGSWNGKFGTTISPKGICTITAKDAVGTVLCSGTLTVAGIASLTVTPNPFEPGNGHTCTVTAVVDAGVSLNLDAYVGIVKTLQLTATDATIYSAVWDGAVAGGWVPAGIHPIQLYNRDSGLRYDISPSVSLTVIDNTPPETVIQTGPVDGSTVCPNVSFSWGGQDNLTAAGNLTYAYHFDGEPWSAFASTTSVSRSLPAGAHGFEVKAKDQAGNEDPSPAARQFVVDPGVAPVISSITANSTESQCTVTWSTDRAATSQIEYGLTTAYGSQTSMLVQLVTEHSMTLSGLISDENYHFRVRSRDVCGNETVSEDYQFQTVARPNLVVTLDSPPAEAWTGQPITITWTVANTAAVPANGSWQDCGYISFDDQVGNDSQVACQTRLRTLAADGDSYQGTYTGTVPIMPEGYYWIVLRTDAGNSLIESNEADNVAVVGPLHIRVTPLPPLIADIPDGALQDGMTYTGPTPTLTQGTPPITWSLVAGPAGMVIDPATGVVTWADATITGSPHPVTIRATNALGSDDESWQLRVMTPPVLAELLNDQVFEGAAYTGQTPELTQGSSPLTWTLLASPAGMTINSSTGVVSWSSPVAVGSPHTITVRVANAVGSDQRSWQLTVSPAAPLIADIADANIRADRAYSGSAPLLIQGTRPVTWSLSAGPAGMTINPSTGVVSWPAPTEVGNPHTVTLLAVNAIGGAEESWTLTAILPPVVDAIGDAVVPEGIAYTGPTPQLVQGTAPITWSLITGPPGMTIDSATGVVSWASPVAAANDWTVAIRASNWAGNASETWSLTVPASYTATVAASLHEAPAGQSILLYGQATRLGTGEPVPNAPVTIRVRVRGTRRVIALTTNGLGNFQTVFQPLSNEAGIYSIGADHPSVTADKTDDQFTLYGMSANPAQATHVLLPGGAASGEIQLANLGDVALSGITAVVQGAGSTVDVQVTAPENLSPLGAGVISYTVQSVDTQAAQGSVLINLTSTEGAATTAVLGITIKPPMPTLAATPGSLSAGMLRGTQTLVQFNVTNTGGAASGNLSVQLPATSWMTLASPATIASLNPGDSAAVVLRLTPAGDLPLGPYSGAVVAVGSAVSISVPFQFNAISNGVGDLRVTAVDEYTYFAEGSPNVADATVTLKHPVTGAVIVSGVTDASGTLLLTGVTEAHYNVEVTAPDHGTFRTTLLVIGGQTKELSAFLPRQMVSYQWTVVPTQVVDEYRVSVEAVYQTNVPAPVVTVDPPMVDLNAIGCDAQIDFTITNHGLIRAENVHVNFAGNARYELDPLVEQIGDLEAMSSVVVPVHVHDLWCGPSGGASRAWGKMAEGDNPCTGVVFDVGYDYVCGVRHFYLVPVFFQLPQMDCPGSPPSGNGGGFSGGGSSGSQEDSPYVVPAQYATPDVCDSCGAKQLKALVDCAVDAVPELSCPFKLIKAGTDCVYALQTESNLPAGAVTCIKNGTCTAIGCMGSSCGDSVCGEVFTGVHCFQASDPGGCIADLAFGGVDVIKNCAPVVAKKFPLVFAAITVVKCGYGLLTACDGEERAAWLPGGPEAGRQAVISSLPLEDLERHLARMQTIADVYIELFGDEKWLSCEVPQAETLATWFYLFMAGIDESSEDGVKVSTGERDVLLAMPLPDQLNATDVAAFIERWNRSMDYWAAGIRNAADVPQGQSTDFVALDLFASKWAAADLAVAAESAEGFGGLFDGAKSAMAGVYNDLTNQSEGVCAKVRIRIDQQAVVSRSGFMATLELDNDSTAALENIAVTLDIRDADGTTANTLFGIYPPVLSGLADVSGGGNLPPSSSGSARWTIVATDEAAPTAPAFYTVGGTLTYVTNGVTVTIPLYPAQIQVLPNPNLHLKYFLEQQVYSDDPFTLPVEPPVPFYLGLILSNTGAGSASDVHITSAQPEIIENERGLLIDFKIIGTQLGGQSVSPSLTVDMGDLGPNQSAVARWQMTASLEGRFCSYRATFEHIDPLGDPRLSLIEDVRIFETQHSVRVEQPGDDGQPDFLVIREAPAGQSGTQCSTPAEEQLPTEIHSSDGTVLPVSALTTATIDGPLAPDDLEVQLTANVPGGWVYLRAVNPGTTQYRLVRVLRSDNSEVRIVDNAWTTHRMVRPQGEPAYAEDFVHIVDKDSDGSYRLIYEQIVPPMLVTAVSSKQHGATGSFNIDLLNPLGSNDAAVECRSGGPTRLVLTFDQPVFGAGGLDASDVHLASTSAGNVTVTSVAINGDRLTIDLQGVSDASRMTVTLPGIIDAEGTPSTQTLCLAVMEGDVTGDEASAATNIYDLVVVREHLAESVMQTNARCDVTADGSINVLDLVKIRNKLNVSAPATCP